MYVIKVLKEIRIWYKLKKLADANIKILNSKNFRVDWLGRIYTVINLPDEIYNHNEEVKHTYILTQFRDFDKIFLDIGIAPYVFPEFSKIKNSNSYLLVLQPERVYLKFSKFFLFIFKLSLLAIIGKIFYNLYIKYNIEIMNIFKFILDLF